MSARFIKSFSGNRSNSHSQLLKKSKLVCTIAAG
jgi:hypothetical protein